jgi:hypothetical protein
MKHIPMLFTPAMGQALWEGRKTQTRRLWKPHKLHKPEPHQITVGESDFICRWHSGIRHDVPMPIKPGDLIWPKERWRVGAWHWGNGEIAVDFTDGPIKEWRRLECPDMFARLVDQSRQDAANANVPLNDMSYWEYSWPPGDGPTRWRSSLHMPKAAGRMTLSVTEVRVERLNDIDVLDAVAEGIQPETLPDGSIGYRNYRNDLWPFECPVHSFQSLWDKINADTAPWASNPWVIVYTFEMRRQNILEVAA